MAAHHPVFARFYPKISRSMERGGMAEHRRALLAGLTGTVLEIGAGDGLNFRHYPDTVSEVVAVEPEPYLRRLAGEAAGRAAVPVEVVDGRAEQLPLADGGVDAVVVSLVLCSVRDQDVALREIHRVLKPGGRLRFLEHVRADTPGMVRAQRVLEATIWPLLAGGCHLSRDTAAAVERSGFHLEHLDRFWFAGVRTPSSRIVLGSALRQH